MFKKYLDVFVYDNPDAPRMNSRIERLTELDLSMIYDALDILDPTEDNENVEAPGDSFPANERKARLMAIFKPTPTPHEPSHTFPFDHPEGQ